MVLENPPAELCRDHFQIPTVSMFMQSLIFWGSWPKPYMLKSQDHVPFLGPYYKTAPQISGTQTETAILTTHL